MEDISPVSPARPAANDGLTMAALCKCIAASALIGVTMLTATPLSATETERDESQLALPEEPDSSPARNRFPFDMDFPFFGDDEQQGPIRHGGITILGVPVPPATSTTLSWKPQDTFESIAAPTPVLILNGANPGPTLCLTGAVHGDEINGIEIIRQVFFSLDPDKLSGTLLGVPIVNQMGFRRASRYLPDRRDLNRYFPGNPRGSSASRIAHAFFTDIIVNCDALVDLHTGSFHRTNIPQLRADMRNEGVAQLAHGFGGMIVLHSDGAEGTLRRAAVDTGIPAVTIEAGEPMRIQEDVVEDGVQRIRTLMTNLGMYKRPMFWSEAEPVYVNSRWVRSEQGGLLISNVELGEEVSPGDSLGRVVNPINNREYPVTSPHEGRVIGMALNQVVMPGYAIYHIGIAATRETLEEQPPPHRENGEESDPARIDIPEVEYPEFD